MRILVADDNAMIRNLLEVSLASSGYEVVTACDGRDAVGKLREQTADLVLMDLRMPVLDGLGALREIRADPSLRAVPVVAITAHAGPEGRAEALGAGFNGLLHKPIHHDLLLGEIRQQLPPAK